MKQKVCLCYTVFAIKQVSVNKPKLEKFKSELTKDKLPIPS